MSSNQLDMAKSRKTVLTICWLLIIHINSCSPVPSTVDTDHELVRTDLLLGLLDTETESDEAQRSHAHVRRFTGVDIDAFLHRPGTWGVAQFLEWAWCWSYVGWMVLEVWCSWQTCTSAGRSTYTPETIAHSPPDRVCPWSTPQLRRVQHVRLLSRPGEIRVIVCLVSNFLRSERLKVNCPKPSGIRTSNSKAALTPGTQRSPANSSTVVEEPLNSTSPPARPQWSIYVSRHRPWTSFSATCRQNKPCWRCEWSLSWTFPHGICHWSLPTLGRPWLF